MNPALNVFIIALNAEDTIEQVLLNLSGDTAKALPFDVRVVVVEGYAKPCKDTSWCKELEEGKHYKRNEDGMIVSVDNTEAILSGEYGNLNGVRVIRSKTPYEGKVEMVNAALDALVEMGMKKDDILMQMDADEVWGVRDLVGVMNLFSSVRDNNAPDHAFFVCHYYLGYDTMVLPSWGKFGNKTSYEWKRAWRVKDTANRFITHEPPVLQGESKAFTHEQTWSEGLYFRHFAYAFENQVKFKADYYNRPKILEEWRDLQGAPLPCCALDTFPMVQDDVWCIRGDANRHLLSGMSGGTLAILYHQGLGDAVIMFGAVKWYMDAGCNVIIYAPPPYAPMIRRMYDVATSSPTPTVVEAWTIEEAYDYMMKTYPREQRLVLGCLGSGWDEMLAQCGTFDKAMYAQARVPFSYKYQWSEPRRDGTNWMGYDKIGKLLVDGDDCNDITPEVADMPQKPFYLVHDDALRGYAIREEKFDWNIAPKPSVVRVDSTRLNFWKWVNIASNPLCIGVHCIDSSFLNALAVFGCERPVFWHRYARSTAHAPHFPSWVKVID